MKIESDFDYRFEWKKPDKRGVDPNFMPQLASPMFLRIQITPGVIILRLGRQWTNAHYYSWIENLEDSISIKIHTFENVKINSILTLEEATEIAWEILKGLETFMPLKIDKQNKELIWLEKKE